MTIWADGDAISPNNMNNQHVSGLTVGITFRNVFAPALTVSHTSNTAAGLGTTVAAAFDLEQTGNPFAVQVGAQGTVQFNHTSNFTRAAFGLEGFGLNISSGSVADLRGGQFVLLNSGSGSIDSAIAVFAAGHSNTGTGSIGTAIGLFAEAQTSATTNYPILCEGVLSVSSSAQSLPSAVSSRGYMYVGGIGAQAGALYYVGGSGSSTTIAVA